LSIFSSSKNESVKMEFNSPENGISTLDDCEKRRPKT